MSTRKQIKTIEDLQATSFYVRHSVPAGRENLHSVRDEEAEAMIEELEKQIGNSSPTAATVAPSRVMTCSACGDYMPCVRTPQGWLCNDCCGDA